MGVEGDYNAGAHLTMGLRSSLQVEIKNLLWFRVNVAPEVPLVLTSVGTSQDDLIHTCGVAGLNLDASHEADIHVKLHNHSFDKHWGPKVDANYHNESAVSKCIDIHPPKPSVVMSIVCILYGTMKVLVNFILFIMVKNRTEIHKKLTLCMVDSELSLPLKGW